MRALGELNAKETAALLVIGPEQSQTVRRGRHSWWSAQRKHQEPSLSEAQSRQQDGY